MECLNRCSKCKSCIDRSMFKPLPPLIYFNMQPEISSCLNDIPLSAVAVRPLRRKS